MALNRLNQNLGNIDDNTTNFANLYVNGFPSGATIIGLKSQPDMVSMVIRADSAQTSDLTQWQNSAGTAVTRIDAAGNITTPSLTATGAISAASITVSSVNNTGVVTGAAFATPDYQQIAFPGGGRYLSGNGTQTGAIAITLPVGWTNSMVRMTVKIFEYATNKSFEVVIAGYNYAPSSYWTNTSAYIVGNPGIDRNFTVRFGYTAAGKCVVYIGELASTWSIPAVYVTDVQIGYSGQSASWATGWSVGYQAAAFENVSSTVTSPQIGRGSVTNVVDTLVQRGSAGEISVGAITADSGGATLTLKPGTVDHNYIAIFADSQATTTRSGWFGYGSAGTSQMSITNEMTNGGINLAPNGTGTVTVSGNTAWHAGNDGAASGLDADLLDGQHGSVYAPPGMLTQYAGSSAPTGWLLCDGTEKAITTYGGLYAVVGTTYGALTNGAGAAGTTHFRVPDLRGRIPMGAGTGAGDGASGTNTLPAGTALTARTLGAWGGAQGTSLTVSHIPQHDHAIDHDHVAFTTASGGTHSHTFGADDQVETLGGYTYAGAFAYDATSNPSGNGRHLYVKGDGAHTHSIDVPAFTGTSGTYGTVTVTPVPTVPPFIVVNYIIKT